MSQSNIREGPVFRFRKRRLRIMVILLMVLLLVIVGTSWRLVKRLFADCDYALRIQIAALAISTPQDIDLAFETVGIIRPGSVDTVVEAQEYLLKASAEIGCEDRIQSSYLLGKLLLHQKRYDEAARWLEHSVEAAPTLDGFLALSEAYEALGEENKALRARVLARTCDTPTLPDRS